MAGCDAAGGVSGRSVRFGGCGGLWGACDGPRGVCRGLQRGVWCEWCVPEPSRSPAMPKEPGCA